MTKYRYRLVSSENAQDLARRQQRNRARTSETPSLSAASSRGDPWLERISELAAVGPSPDF